MKRFFVVAGLSCALFVYKFFIYPEHKPANDVVNLALSNFSKSFDPAIAFNDDSLVLMSQSQESLYQYHYLKRPFEIIPALAAELPRVSADGLRYRIEIKKAVYYHPHLDILGSAREMVIDDFILQIKRLAFKPLKSTGRWLFDGKLKGFREYSEKVGDSYQKMIETDMSGIRKIDRYTMELELVKAEPNLLYFLAMNFVTPVPIELVEAYQNNLKDILIGTGPYIYQGLKDNTYLFEKNKNFRGEFYPTVGDREANEKKLLKASQTKIPFIERLIFHVFPDEDEMWQAFQDERLDLIDVPRKFLAKVNSLTEKELEAYQEEGIIMSYFPSQRNRWLGFNMKDTVVGKNLNLRKAIAHAIDFSKYIEQLTQNTNLRANSMYNPSLYGYDPAHTLPYEFNLEKAKFYLQQAGYQPGELTLTYSTRGIQEIHYKEAEFLKTQLQQIGVNLKIDVINFADFLKRGRSGELQFWTDSWIYDYPDSENLLQLLISKNHPGINKSAYSNPKLDALYIRLAQTLDRDKRIQIMREIEHVVEQDIPWILLAYDSAYIIRHERLKNYRKSFFSRNFVKYLEIN